MASITEQIISQALSREPGTTARRLLAARRKKVERQLDKRADLLARPDLLEKRTSAHAQVFTLSTRKLRTRKWGTKTEALESQAKGTPQEGFASDLLDAYTAALEEPKFLKLSNRQLLAEVAKELMVAPDVEGRSRLERGWEHKYRADTSLGNLFGVFGEDKDTRKLPGYEQYLEKKRAEPVDEWHTGPVEAAAIGGGFTAALMLGSKALGRAAMFAPAPGARIVGGALMAIPEFMAFDAIHNVIAKTDWGRARTGTWRKLGADMLAGGVVLGGGYKAATVAIRKAAEKSILSKGVTEVLMKHPTAKRAIEAGEAQKVARLEQARANEAVIRNIGKEEVLNEVANLSAVLERARGIKMAEATEARMFREAARPVPPRMPGPGLVKPTVPGTWEAPVRPAARKGVRVGAKVDSNVQSILDVQMPTAALSVGAARKVFARELTELRADMALRKTARTAKLSEAITEQREIQRLAKAQAEKERIFLAREKGEAVVETEKRMAAEAKKVAKKRGAQRTKLRKKKKVEADVAAILPGPVLTTAETKAMLAEAKKARVKLRKKGVKVTKVSPEATGLTEEARAAMDAVENETRKTVSIAEESGLEELLYGGGAEETFTEAVKKGGKDLTELMKNGEKILGIGIGIFGSIALADLFSPDTAEASMLRTAAIEVPRMVAQTAKAAKKAATKEGMAQLAKEWKDINALHIPAAEGAKAKEYFQEAIRIAPLAVKEHGDLIKNIKAETTPMRLVKILSPYTSGEILYKINPVPEIGNLQSVIGNNAGDSLKVFGNIVRDVPGIASKKATKDIVDTMTPIAKRFSTDVTAYRAVEMEISKTEKAFTKLYKALDDEKGEVHIPALEKIEARRASLAVAREELAPAFEAYLKEVDVAHRVLAKKYPATRIALAVEDTAAYTKYPWLKPMMKPEEEEAVIWIKNMYESYGVRMVEAGHDVIEGPYCHHVMHPDWLEKGAAARLADFGLDSKGVPFARFHHRAKYSKQMVPDINYIMQRYLMDAERRIQWSQFWGKGQKNSWYSHKRWIDTFGTKDQKEFWRRIADSSIPPAQTKANILANIYSSFEVLRLLAFSPSVALKHYFKNVGTASTMGVGNFASHLPEAAITAIKGSRNSPEMKQIYKLLGIKSPQGQRKVFREVADSFITQIHRMNMVADLDFEAMIPNKAGFAQAVTTKLQSFNRWGSIPVRAIESVDRHHTVVAAWEAAAKRGMTAQQAIYGIYSNILKVNFLSGAANPAWIRNPKIRAMLLFQNTVFKIMERRMMTAWRAGKDVKTAIGLIRHQDIQQTLKEMGEIGKYVLGAEKEMKQNMIFDALTGSKDFFGTPAIKQAMTEAILSGAILMGAGVIGMNMMPQVWHVPLLRHGAKAPTIAVNPFVNAAFRMAGEREKATEYGVEQDFFMTQFMKNWLRSTGYLPQTLNKMVKMSKDDVPEIYKGSRWQYFFSVPAYGEHY